MNESFETLDLLACYGTDVVSRAISYCTASLWSPRRLWLGPSHIALICQHRDNPVWIESTTRCRHPCAILNERLAGVQAHLPEQRIEDYTISGGRVDLYRLSPIDRVSAVESELLSKILIRHFIGRRVTYDLGGALLSGTRLLKRTRLLPGADLNQLFCSELAAAVLMRLGRLNRANPTRYNPGSLLRQLVRQGTYQFTRSFASGDNIAA